MNRFASIALWIAYGLLVTLVAVQLWAMERAVNDIKNLECNLAIVSLIEADLDVEMSAVTIELLNKTCPDGASILVEGP